MATVGVSSIAVASTVSVYKDAASLGFGPGWVLLWLRDNLLIVGLPTRNFIAACGVVGYLLFGYINHFYQLCFRFAQNGQAHTRYSVPELLLHEAFIKAMLP